MIGIIKSINRQKSYGWIHHNGIDYFFHKSEFQGHWNDLISDFNPKHPISVEFEELFNSRGPRATNVKRLDFPNRG